MSASKEISENATIGLLTISRNLSSNSYMTWISPPTPSEDESLTDGCQLQQEIWHSNLFGVTLALPEWEAILTVILLSIIIVLTIVGNILVILSVFTYKPLRIVQNFFIVSLAVADLTVALLVLPFNVAYSTLGRWEFGIHMCKLWLTCDIMCCTSSILNLCIIALDRFWAITDPINYAHKRTVSRVLFLIGGVWILSFIISSPPLFGWNDWPEEFLSTTPCELTTNRGYVIYSSLGSFFIPLVIMTIVYAQIYISARRRLRERRLASKMYGTSMKTNELEVTENTEAGRKSRTTTKTLTLYSIFVCCGRNLTRFEDPLTQNDNASVSSETRGNADQKRESQDEQHQEKALQKININTEDSNDTYPGNQSSSCDKTQIEQLNRLEETNKEKVKDQPSVEGKDIDMDSSSQNLSTNENIPNKVALSQSLLETCDLTVTFEKKSTGVYQFIEEKQKISLSKERRAARTLGIIMGVFVICWLPFFLMYVILSFCETCCPTQKFKNFVTWLGYINSSLNPFIYTIFNLDFRRAFKRLLGMK